MGSVIHPGAHRVWTIGRIVGLCLLALACRNPSSERIPAVAARLLTDDYADEASCAGCHKTIAATYRSVAMAQSFGPAEPDRDLPGLDEDTTLDHALSGFSYEIGWRNGHLVQRRFERDSGGARVRVFERDATFAVGSGRHARSFLHRGPNGDMTMLPVTWYREARGWRMSPGYDRREQFDFTRPVTYLCIFCHDGTPAAPAGADSVATPPLFPERLPSGIGCQRCHGPGARHVDLARSSSGSFQEIRASIVNPRRLPAERQIDICMQCHLETTSDGNWSILIAPGRSVFSFRPGDDLAEYRIDFDRPAGSGFEDSFEIAHQAYRLRQARCFKESGGRLICTTCHDPHRRPEDPDRLFASKCLGCHTAEQCPPTRRAKSRGGAGPCATCHMPKRRTDDIVHVVVTDHRIGLYPSRERLLAPRRESETSYRGPIVFYRPDKAPAGVARDLLLGLGSVQDGVDAVRGLRLLEGAVAASPPRAPEPWIALGIARLAAGRPQDAVASLERAASLDPANPKIPMFMGNALLAARQPDMALRKYDAALRLWPLFSEAETNAGNLLYQAGRLNEALARYDRALAIKPENAEAHSNRGALLARLGKIDAAIAELEEALRIDPRQPEPYVNLTSILESRGRGDRVSELLEAGAFHCPSHPGLLSRLAFLLATATSAGARDGERANRLASRAIELTGGNDPRALDALAAALAETGETARAAEVAGHAEGLARAAGQADLAAAIGHRKDGYLKGRPYRRP